MRSTHALRDVECGLTRLFGYRAVKASVTMCRQVAMRLRDIGEASVILKFARTHISSPLMISHSDWADGLVFIRVRDTTPPRLCAWGKLLFIRP
jgi:hypothetical protein